MLPVGEGYETDYDFHSWVAQLLEDYDLPSLGIGCNCDFGCNFDSDSSVALLMEILSEIVTYFHCTLGCCDSRAQCDHVAHIGSICSSNPQPCSLEPNDHHDHNCSIVLYLVEDLFLHTLENHQHHVAPF